MMGWTGPTTLRQAHIWDEFLMDEWNRPSRSDHYLMAIAAEIRAVRGMFARSPRPVRLGDFIIKFKPKQEEAGSWDDLSEEEKQRRLKFMHASMRARLGMGEPVPSPDEREGE